MLKKNLKLQKILVIFVLVVLQVVVLIAVSKGNDELPSCPPDLRNTLPLLQQSQADYNQLALESEPLKTDKSKLIIFLSNYTYQLFYKNGYSLPRTIDSCVKGQFDPQFNYNYMKSGLQNLLSPVLMAAFDKNTSNEVIDRGYIYKETVEFLHKIDNKDTSPRTTNGKKYKYKYVDDSAGVGGLVLVFHDNMVNVQCDTLNSSGNECSFEAETIINNGSAKLHLDGNCEIDMSISPDMSKIHLDFSKNSNGCEISYVCGLNAYFTGIYELIQ